MATARRQRLDRELVRRELARSRQHATDLISAGRVLVGGTAASKGTTMVERSAAVIVTEAPSGEADYVSRGAHKLLGALRAFEPLGLQVGGKFCLDAGASTGGFTDVLLRHDAAHVVAADVGYGQLAWALQQDKRVTVMDRTNIRALEPQDLAEAPEIVVSDLSFISLKTVLPALAQCAAPGADLLLMVKPQFEVGRERLGSGGVVRSPQLRVESVLSVAECAQGLGLAVKDVVASPLPGPSGNVEYFLWLVKVATTGPAAPSAAAAAVAGAVETAAAGATAPTAGDLSVPESPYLSDEALRVAIERAVAEGPRR